MKQITVFGASGKVGRLVVEELLSKNYSVVAFIHSNNQFPNHKNFKVVKGSIYDSISVEKAIKSSDGIISALGSWGTPKKDILREGFKNIIPAAEKAGIKKVVSLTGHGATAPNDKFDLLHEISRFMLVILANRILKDGEEHIIQLNNSKLNWTVLRSSLMVNFGSTTKYNLTMKRPLPLAIINRTVVAKALVSLLDDKQYNRKAPFILLKDLNK